jgi:hypothetical protein
MDNQETVYKNHLKRIIPSPIWQTISRMRYTIKRATLYPSATFHPLRRKSIKALSEYKNKHQGQRCFIIGNGPSLQKIDLSLLKNEYSFGMNRIYLMFPELGFSTSYYISVNSLVIEQCAEDIRQIKVPKFLSWRSKEYINPTEDTIFLHTTYSGSKFARDIRGRLWEGATVTYIALQIAFFMGFDQVILIGVDHNFDTKGKPNTTVTSLGDDPNHFNPNYFGKGFRWQLPDLETSEKAYHMALEAYNEAHKEVLDATVDGKLQVFPKVNYGSLFND